MVGSTFDKDVGDAISPHAGLTSTEGSQVSPHDIERNFDTIDPPNISEDAILDDLFQQSLKCERDIIDIMVSTLHAGKYSGIHLAHLFKSCHIVNTAGKQLNITSQRSTMEEIPKLYYNYGTITGCLGQAPKRLLLHGYTFCYRESKGI